MRRGGCPPAGAEVADCVFFQAEDGIRDVAVTGVQTCALPISGSHSFQWFISKTVRQATAMRKHVQKLLNHQRDILSPQAVDAVNTALAAIQKTVAEIGRASCRERV